MHVEVQGGKPLPPLDFDNTRKHSVIAKGRLVNGKEGPEQTEG